MKINRILLHALCLIALLSYNSAAAKQSDNSTLDSTIDFQDDSLKQLIYAIQTKDGKTRVFYQHITDTVFYELCTKLTCDDDTRVKRYSLWEDYDTEQGSPIPLPYTISPDGKNLYFIGFAMANSAGFVSNYTIFKIDCQTLKKEAIDSGAAIEVTSTGFTIVDCRCINEKTAKCNGDLEWKMHDRHIDWNGKTISEDKNEYDYDTMVARYGNSDDDFYLLLRGFKQIKPSICY
ncbi:MAG: hypothetical protein SPE23_09505 [Sodaliphilus sp.]|nr:hypothetical protein [Sodaliphilus sp.]